MYPFILTLHTWVRWLVLLSLCYAIFMAFRGKYGQMPFTKKANSVRHWTATIAHIELMIGIFLYTQSPTVKYFFENGLESWSDPVFFGLVHIFLMLTAIVIITIGSAKAKRKSADADKYKTMLTYFSIGLLLIIIAIPWPFSPLAHRPYIRPF